MQTLARLFGHSPFSPLEAHMAAVAQCVHLLPALFNALAMKDYDKVAEMGEEISKKEHEADEIKNDIRNHLPSGLFLPVSRAGLLDILSLQDGLADKAEDTAVLLSIHNLLFHESFSDKFFALLEKNLEVFESVWAIIKRLNLLLESSFGGTEAEKIRKHVHRVSIGEHESDILQRQLLKTLFKQDAYISGREFFLWMKIIHAVSGISDVAEKLANRVCMILE
ncbi:UPF0111 protein [Candidatus Clavichlamydia salmonicola]|uniref:TIGR00153 family protein n=1 Tax=Candidatus Clavichlamydia salmonicola TaxID=469812 RepID=UPI0018919DDA|nr:TIGR00153 family protein [Candidatus Clavichlamydia salmonicola]MBF5050724.1 UPF0111 protein [Candidatus Clavichlamydia salmonicola]